MSLVISADSQRLSASGFSPALWSSTTDLTIVAKVKVTASFWANFFGITDAGNETFNSAILRAANGTVYDHLVRLQGDGGGRLEAAGSVNANAWDTIGITVLGGVARIAYLNGVATQTTNTAQNTFNSPFDGIWIGFFQPEGLGQSTGRFKVAHCAAWKTGLSAAQHAALHNGGTAGAGVNPTSVANSDLVFYAPLTTDATVTRPSGLSLVATGSPTYDSGDNPAVDPPPFAGSDLTGNITLTAIDPSGSLGQNPSTLAGSITLAALAPTGSLGVAPGTITTFPFSRNTGSRPTGLSGVALAILSDDANMTRLAGATSLSQDGSGRVVYSGAGLPSFGTSVLVVTREPDGKLGLERYTVQ